MSNKIPPKIHKIPQNSKHKGTITFIAEYKEMKSDQMEVIDQKIL